MRSCSIFIPRSLEGLERFVDGVNIFLREVFGISVDVLDNGGGVNGTECKSDNSIIAALQNDSSWA